MLQEQRRAQMNLINPDEYESDEEQQILAGNINSTSITKPINIYSPQLIKAAIDLKKNDPLRLKVPVTKIWMENNIDILFLA